MKTTILCILKHFLATIIEQLFALSPIDNNKIFSMNYTGKGYGDNGKYICDEIIKLRPDIKIIWPVKNSLGDAPKNVLPVKFYTPAYFYHICTSKIWINNSRMPLYFRKRKHQYYVQTWHGSTALKRIEKDAESKLEKYYVKSAKKDSRMADLFISNGKHCTKMYKNIFWYDGEIMECGTPRNDILYKKAQNKIHDILKIDSDVQIATYAPTFRSNYSLDAYNLDIDNLKKTLEEETKRKWIIIVRLHPTLVGRGIKFKSKIAYDMSDYPDMYEILAETNLLITDYSSTMFEAGYANIPVLLYSPDIAEYKNDRNFYFDLEKLPFPLAKNNKELFCLIKKWNQAKYETDISIFKKKLGVKENGKASQAVAKRIIEKMDE